MVADQLIDQGLGGPPIGGIVHKAKLMARLERLAGGLERRRCVAALGEDDPLDRQPCRDHRGVRSIATCRYRSSASLARASATTKSARAAAAHAESRSASVIRRSSPSDRWTASASS